MDGHEDSTAYVPAKVRHEGVGSDDSRELERLQLQHRELASRMQRVEVSLDGVKDQSNQMMILMQNMSLILQQSQSTSAPNNNHNTN